MKLMFNVIVEILCGYEIECLLRIASIDNPMIDVHVDTLMKAYTRDIANESLDCDMTPRYWVICE